MLIMLALTLMLLLDAFVVVAYAADDDANADAKMPKVARHLASAYIVLWIPPLLPMHMLLRQLMRADACDDVMLQSVYMCLFVPTYRVCVMFVYMFLCVRAFALRE